MQSKNFGQPFYEFHRDFSMGANTFQSNLAGQGKSVWHYNMWGGQLGGPIILPKVYDGRDKTFFFFNYEGMRDTEPRFTTRSLPTADQRGGDFSNSFAVSNNRQVPLLIYDPLTTAATTGVRQPFPGDKIPTARLSAISQKVLSFVPLPNVSGGPEVATGTNDFVPNVPTVDPLDSAVTRLDHQFNEKNRPQPACAGTIGKRPLPTNSRISRPAVSARGSTGESRWMMSMFLAQARYSTCGFPLQDLRIPPSAPATVTILRNLVFRLR
jgi:hypothetical protein